MTTYKPKSKIKIEAAEDIEILSASDIVVKSGGNIYLNRS
jgi:hypothetical protein